MTEARLFPQMNEAAQANAFGRASIPPLASAFGFHNQGKKFHPALLLELL